MTTISTIDYALMAGAAYISNRAEINRFPIPSGWIETKHADPQDGSGFEAISFINGTTIANSTEIVISYAGTDFSQPGSDFLHGNIPLAIGIVSDQLKQAAEYYLQVKALAPASAHITLTGHSLGGGIAALVGVFFGEIAKTFDQAPFYLTATQGASVLKDYLLARLDTNGNRLYSDAVLSGLTGFIEQQQANGGIPNNELITNVNVQGEIVSAGSALRVGNETSIPQSSSVGLLDAIPFAINLHSQALLTVFEQSKQTAATGQALNEVTVKLTDLLPMIFDSTLFAYPQDRNNTDNENFLEHLVKHEAGVRDPATGATIIAADQMVYRFTADLWKIAQDGGLTLTDNNLTKSLVSFAMQKYYEEQATGTDYGNTLFSDTDVTGGIRFDRTDVAANLADAKGYNLYFLSYLDSLSTREREAVNQMLPTLTDWFVQAGNAPMNATASGNSAFMLGGSGGDRLTGGRLTGDAANDSNYGLERHTA